MIKIIEEIEPIVIDDSIAPGIKSNTYAIYYNGTVKNIKTGRVMSQHPNAKGYPCINLRMKDGRNNSYLVHRLMMKAYYPIENQDSLDIDHKNCKVNDYRFSNLEWVTRKENLKRAYDNGLTLKGEDCVTAILNESDARFVCEHLEKGTPLKEIESLLEERLGPGKKCHYHGRVRDILTRRKWKHISKEYNFQEYHIQHRRSRKSK